MSVLIYDRNYIPTYSTSQVTWLLGTPFCQQTLAITARVGSDMKPSLGDVVEIIGNSFFIMNGKNWADYGFKTGNNVTISYTKIDLSTYIPTNNNLTFLSVNILGNEMQVSSLPSGLNTSILPSQDADYQYTNVNFFCDNPIEALEFEYGFLKNSEVNTDNISSVIDGSIQKFIATGLNTLSVGDSTSLLAVGNKSGHDFIVGIITYIGKPSSYEYSFTLYLSFRLTPFFEGPLNWTVNDIPAWFQNQECLTDNFKFKFLPETNNPNRSIQNEMSATRQLGNTGFFNQNFNGLPNPFVVESVTYRDTNGNIVSSILVNEETTIEVVISGITPHADGQYFHSLCILPNEDDYKNNEYTLGQNIRLLTNSQDPVGITPSPNALEYFSLSPDGVNYSIKNVRYYNDGSGNLKFEGVVTMYPGISANILNGNIEGDFILSISVASHDLDTADSNRVTLYVDSQQFIERPPVIEELDTLTVKFLEHPYDVNSIGEFIYQGYVEDDVLAVMDFQFERTDNMIINNIRLNIDIVKNDFSESFRLTNLSVNTSAEPISGTPSQSIHEINNILSRGFKYNNGNDKNFYGIERNSNLDNALQVGYRAYLGFKIRWEDWISNSNVPNVFVDASLLNNGKNHDWFRFIESGDWSIYVGIDIDGHKNGEPVSFRNTFPFEFGTYDQNTCFNKEHRYYDDSTNDLLNLGIDPDTGNALGIILNDGYTRIEIYYEGTGALGCEDILSLLAQDLLYATITIQIDKGAGQMEHRQISSVIDREADCPLIPLVGEDYLLIEQEGVGVVTKCLVDPDLLPLGSKYSISGRIEVNYAGCQKPFETLGSHLNGLDIPQTVALMDAGFLINMCCPPCDFVEKKEIPESGKMYFLGNHEMKLVLERLIFTSDACCLNEYIHDEVQTSCFKNLTDVSVKVSQIVNWAGLSTLDDGIFEYGSLDGNTVTALGLFLDMLQSLNLPLADRPLYLESLLNEGIVFLCHNNTKRCGSFNYIKTYMGWV